MIARRGASGKARCAAGAGCARMAAMKTDDIRAEAEALGVAYYGEIGPELFDPALIAAQAEAYKAK